MDESSTSTLKGRIKDAVETLAGDATGPEGKDAARDRAADFGEWLEGFVRSQPLVALLAAAGIGYSLAFMGRRRQR